MKKENKKEIEVIASPLIINKRGEILLKKSNKWGGFYLIPGRRLNPDEEIFKCAFKEGEKETGLKLKPLYCVNVGELINNPSPNKKTHLIYFHIVCESLTEDIKSVNVKIQKYIWIKPEEALKQLNILNKIDDTIKNYINGTKINICSDIYYS